MSEENRYFFGLDEVSGQLNSGTDQGLKDEYIAHFAQTFNCHTVRVWLNTKEIIRVGEEDKIEFVAEGLIKLHNYLDTLRRHGVERFLLLEWGFVYPYGYIASDRNVVPDPKNEPDMYKRFLLLQQKVRFEIASNFSLVEYYESTNEPDGENGLFFHKNGFHLNGKDNKDYIFTREEVEDIVLDLNYYENIGIKMANPDAKMLLPAFCNFPYGPSYLDNIYTKIESVKYPTVGEIKSNRIESFFEVLNWHPYNLVSVQINDEWMQTQENLRKVILKHNDGNRKVWFTENGWSDFKREDEKQDIAKRYIDLFNAVSETMPWVETVFLFRLFNLANRPEDEGEDNFGLIHNEYDWYTPLLPKPAAVSIYKYSNGESASLDPLYKYAINKDKELFPFYRIKGGSDSFKVLIVGNHIAYQRKAEWNGYNSSKGMDSSTADKDYCHLIYEELKNKNGDVDMTVIDARVWEYTFYYHKLYDELTKFNDKEYDLVIVQLGDNVGFNSFKDHCYKDDFGKLCNYFVSKKTKLIITGTFAGNINVNEHQKEAAKLLNAAFVSFKNINMNYSLLSEQKYLNNEHKMCPNDLGMKAIAEAILKECK
ncbi:MAG: SGNH/GDSL hydrolase family protein [Bacilli bacterium]|nr:SGNH/GDSL hydrolase family protein [Bacilli bacterium]